MVLCGISTIFTVLFPRYGQVAHALLTRPPLTKGASPFGPFDLHVLSTPPAFILSQNQTLKFNCLKLLLRATALTLFCWLTLSTCVLKVNWQKLLNNFQRKMFNSFPSIQFLICVLPKPVRRSLMKSSSSISHSKPFVKRFSKLFWKTFFIRFCFVHIRELTHATAYLSYHIRFDLSSEFQNFFEEFWISFEEPVGSIKWPCALHATAWLSYHTRKHLSSGFQNFFQKFWRPFGGAGADMQPLRSSRDSLAILLYFTGKVNCFFQLFRIFFVFFGGFSVHTTYCAVLLLPPPYIVCPAARKNVGVWRGDML